MTRLSISEKRRLARALFAEATGHVAESDWSNISEKNLDVLILCFEGIINGDQEMIATIMQAMCACKVTTNG